MIGSSYGGLITHCALLHHAQAIGMAAVFSPSFYVSEKVFEETQAHPLPADTRVWFYMGGQEYLDGEAGETENVPDVARMICLLSVQKHLPANLMLHVEPQAHHNEAAWRQEFPRAVEWLFGLKARAEPSRAEPSR
jgi:predicted alpha/beta superfamily hydrolase